MKYALILIGCVFIFQPMHTMEDPNQIVEKKGKKRKRDDSIDISRNDSINIFYDNAKGVFTCTDGAQTIENAYFISFCGIITKEKQIKVVKCPGCKRKYPNCNQYIEHCKRRHGEKKSFCFIPQCSFDNKITSLAHLRRHLSEQHKKEELIRYLKERIKRHTKREKKRKK